MGKSKPCSLMKQTLTIVTKYPRIHVICARVLTGTSVFVAEMVVSCLSSPFLRRRAAVRGGRAASVSLVLFCESHIKRGLIEAWLSVYEGSGKGTSRCSWHCHLLHLVRPWPDGSCVQHPLLAPRELVGSTFTHGRNGTIRTPLSARGKRVCMRSWCPALRWLCMAQHWGVVNKRRKKHSGHGGSASGGGLWWTSGRGRERRGSQTADCRTVCSLDCDTCSVANNSTAASIIAQPPDSCTPSGIRAAGCRAAAGAKRR